MISVNHFFKWGKCRRISSVCQKTVFFFTKKIYHNLDTFVMLNFLSLSVNIVKLRNYPCVRVLNMKPLKDKEDHGHNKCQHICSLTESENFAEHVTQQWTFTEDRVFFIWKHFK